MRIWHKNILIGCWDFMRLSLPWLFGDMYDSSSPDVSVAVEQCVFFWKEGVLVRAPESLNSDRLMINYALDPVLPLDLRERLTLIPQSRLFFLGWRLELSPDRLMFGLEVPVLHFTQHCVLIFFELDKVLCILTYSAKTAKTFREGDTMKHSSWGLI